MKPISIIQRFFFTFLSHRNCRENDKTPKNKNLIIFATPVDFFSIVQCHQNLLRFKSFLTVINLIGNMYCAQILPICCMTQNSLLNATKCHNFICFRSPVAAVI